MVESLSRKGRGGANFALCSDVDRAVFLCERILDMAIQFLFTGVVASLSWPVKETYPSIINVGNSCVKIGTGETWTDIGKI